MVSKGVFGYGKGIYLHIDLPLLIIRSITYPILVVFFFLRKIPSLCC